MADMAERKKENIALDDEGFRREQARLLGEGVRSVGEGVKALGEGVKAFGNIASDNRRDVKWYVKLMLVFMFGAVLLVGASVLSAPETWSREYICTMDGYTTTFAAASMAIEFKTLFNNSSCTFKSQLEPGWVGLINSKL